MLTYNCVSALCVTCVTPPLKNPASPLTLDAKFTIHCIFLLLTLRANGLIYFNLKLTFVDAWKTAIVLQDGMRKLGFKKFLDDTHEGYIVTSYYNPTHPNYNFEEFYGCLNSRDQVIYPGKVGVANGKCETARDGETSVFLSEPETF